MAQGKSTLNPNAIPYVPLAMLSFGSRVKAAEITIVASKNKDNYQLPDSFYFEYDNQSFEKLDLSGETSSPTSHSNCCFDDWDDELSEWDPSDLALDLLSSMFPDVAVDYLSDLLEANDDDFADTVDVLYQCESDGDGSDEQAPN